MYGQVLEYIEWKVYLSEGNNFHPIEITQVGHPSQIPGINLTQFNEVGTFRPNFYPLTGIKPELVGPGPYRIQLFAS